MNHTVDIKDLSRTHLSRTLNPKARRPSPFESDVATRRSRAVWAAGLLAVVLGAAPNSHAQATYAFGVPHEALGNAQMAMDPHSGSLLISNIGSSGEDGVRFGVPGLPQGGWPGSVMQQVNPPWGFVCDFFDSGGERIVWYVKDYYSPNPDTSSLNWFMPTYGVPITHITPTFFHYRDGRNGSTALYQIWDDGEIVFRETIRLDELGKGKAVVTDACAKVASVSWLAGRFPAYLDNLGGGWDIVFAEQTELTVSGRPMVAGNHLQIRPVIVPQLWDPASELLSHFELFGKTFAGGVTIGIDGESFGFFGTEQWRAHGDVRFNFNGEQVEVSSIGVGGEDGVDVRMAPASFFSIGLQSVPLLGSGAPAGAFIETSVCATVDNVPDQPVDRWTWRDDGDRVTGETPYASARIIVRLNGVVVAERQGVSGIFARVDEAPTTVMDNLINQNGIPCAGGTWTLPMVIDLPGFGSVTGDQIEVLDENFIGYAESLDTLKVRAGLLDSILFTQFSSEPSVPRPLALTINGQCPGTLRVDWSGTQPNATVALIFAKQTGSFVIPYGPCQGTVLGLGPLGIQLVGTFSSDPNGGGSLQGNAGPAACGGFIQMHDLPACTLSNVEQLQ